MAFDNRSYFARVGTFKAQSSASDASRRHFLAVLAAAGVSQLVTPLDLSARPTAASAKRGLIDFHHHFFPPAFREAALDQYRARERAIVSAWTPQSALEEMDKHRVRTAILSITTPGIWFGESEAARSLARKCNEYAAQLVRDYPGRFGFFASIPLPYIEGSLSEIAYALDVLGADGIGLMTNYGDTWPGETSYLPVFEELDRRNAVVYFHPTAPNCCRNLVSNVPAPLVEFPHDTTRAITSLLYSGSFSRFRKIRFIFSHAGGTIPMLAGRIQQLGTLFGSDKAVPHGVEYELKRLYYEIANSANRAAMAALMNLVPVSQIVFGTDYPFVPTSITAGGLSNLRISAKDLNAIQRANAIALLPRLQHYPPR